MCVDRKINDSAKYKRNNSQNEIAQNHKQEADMQKSVSGRCKQTGTSAQKEHNNKQDQLQKKKKNTVNSEPLPIVDGNAVCACGFSNNNVIIYTGSSTARQCYTSTSTHDNSNPHINISVPNKPTLTSSNTKKSQLTNGMYNLYSYS